MLKVSVASTQAMAHSSSCRIQVVGSFFIIFGQGLDLAQCEAWQPMPHPRMAQLLVSLGGAILVRVFT
jgi:hypothetical protein